MNEHVGLLEEEMLKSEYADDPQMTELITAFVSSFKEKISNIRSHLARRDFSSIARLSHQLKGAGGGYGYPAISQVAAKLEQNAKSNDVDGSVGPTIEELEELCRRAQRAI